MSTREKIIRKHIYEGNFFKMMAKFLNVILSDIKDEKSHEKTRVMIEAFNSLHGNYSLSMRFKRN